MSTETETDDADTFDSDGVEIAYDDVGAGAPIVLVHGFASNREDNWKDPGWYDALTEAGRRVIALDCRGHGESEKPHDPDAYGHARMGEDVIRLLDHLGIEQADLMGYSMGGAISAQLLVDHPDRFNAVVLAGIGNAITEGFGNNEAIAESLEADDPDDADGAETGNFREFAEQRGNDLAALAAVMRARNAPITPEQLGAVERSVLVIAGSEDDVLEHPDDLAQHVPGAEAVSVPDRDHLTTVGDPRFTDAVLDFLERKGL